jgi:hypothetical protein
LGASGAVQLICGNHLRWVTVLLRQCDLRDVGSLSQGFSDAPPTKYREIVMEFAGELKKIAEGIPYQKENARN